ncbi:hypothetical protein [Chamaesiphon minutus]|uniref:Uncharacterized protein n=1 Tax=Chamaesiphon minutus (strain ATCC 27169 / PCC 6605) TaxID=1173020 RepID=K9UDX7_CHAP6|nr:hypothetical protein [Chamaesiphon minutus]AFY92833.1 hypothetical protein Cha6605_1702 [Chamaesiphon minutus PCC 6605]
MSSDEERKALQLRRSDNRNHDTDHDVDDDDVKGFEGLWYAFPPIRNALIAGALLVTGWVVSQFQIPVYVPSSIFGLAILIGAYYWAQEGWEEFMEEREIGIEASMAFTTLGSVILGQWFEAARTNWNPIDIANRCSTGSRRRSNDD